MEIVKTFDQANFKHHEDYLTKRGIDPETREKLGIISTGYASLKKEGTFKVPQEVSNAIVIPYNSPDGTPQGYGARLFYTDIKRIGGFLPGPKYLSEPTEGKRPPGIHFSPLVSWDNLREKQRVFICESFIKANLMCKLGYHAIGISGCQNWTFQGAMNEHLRAIDWRGLELRPVVFMDSNVFPGRSDLWQNTKRMQASFRSLYDLGIGIIELPARSGTEDDHWGLDDFYMERGEVALREVADSSFKWIEAELESSMAQLNSEVVVVRDVGKIVDIERNIFMGRSQFEDINYADRLAKDEVDDKWVPIAKRWTKWSDRTIVDTMKYKPGEVRLSYGDQSYFNLWRGWGCEPVAGDASWFSSWVEDAFGNDDERRYFLDWWGYQLQYPGVKLNTALMLVGPSGVGKGWMAGIAERLFGSDNTWKCNLSDLESKFNSGLGAAQLLVVEEADVTGGVKVYNTLKDLITNEHLRYERKGIDAVKLDNCVNVFLNSNHINVFKLDEFDRRFAVLEITNQSIANDRTYWEPRWEWLRAGGASAVFQLFLEREISSSFDPHGEAPWSQAKSDMVESTHDPRDTWVSEHVIYGEPITVHGRVVDGHLASAKELAWCYEEGRVPLDEVDRRASMRMVKALNSARVAVASGGKKIKFAGYPTKYYWIGTPGNEYDYQEQLKSRVFWSELVATIQGKVASEGGAGYRDKKY